MQTIDSSQAMRDQRLIRWALRLGTAAAIRAALQLLLVFRPANWNLVFVAASAFIVTAPITWKLLQSAHQPGWLSAALAGLLCAVILHPLFWIAHDLTYGPIDFFGSSNILQECFLSLFTVGIVTIPASIFSSIVMVARYQKPSTSINTASGKLHPPTWRLARTPRQGNRDSPTGMLFVVVIYFHRALDTKGRVP